MVTLHRCDVCFELIDPVEGDEHAKLTVELRKGGEQDSIEHIDLCESCRPESSGHHMDWLTHTMHEQGTV